MQTYRAAWDKCLNRLQDILRALQVPAVQEIVTQVTNAHTDVLPGLPYPELPVIALHGINSSFAEEIGYHLECAGVDDASSPHAAHGTGFARVFQVHLHPAECSTVMNMMKAVVTGFVDSGAKRKPTTSLANFDINLLRTWHMSQASRSKLVVFLHEFERFDAHVIQDVLPLVFILLMASPPVPSHLHAVYPRSTLALLRIHPITVSSGVAAIKDALLKTFFDPDFEPDVMVGPGALDYIVDFATRQTTAPDAVLLHMKHFTQPISLFSREELLGELDVDHAEHKLNSEPELQALIEGLQLRLFATTLAAARTREGSSAPGTPRKTNGAIHENRWHANTAGELLECVSRARVAFHKHARRMRVAFAVACIAERVALGPAPVHVNKGGEGDNARLDSLEMLSAVLRGRAGNQVRYVCMAVRKLPLPKLRELFRQLHAFLWNLKSADIKRDEEAARVWIVTTLNQLPPETSEPQTSPDDLQGPQDPAVKQLAATVGDWLQTYIEERLVRLDEQVLWDIWYTGNAPFPSELVNPAPRPTVVAALLHPHDFARAHADLVRASSNEEPPAAVDDNPAREPELWEMQDTSIAFRRYVEAGRMVNVYDWFESFAVVLETQRRKLRKRAQLATQTTPRSQRNGSRRSRSTPKRRAGRADTDMDVDGDETQNGDESDDGEDEEMDEEEEEKWKIEVQARFLRALHELDYMGFVKHTGRKPDHVVRTIYDVPD
ncbi:uncharacterized protein TRAVEDRAFT_71854 [Trametes versicolor FP-101664 SS1]|uniref:uncharacterized protein n=1 Tax=Trametes versicolor (strain FP-101664) TaxID=717944 RepID=UPI0004622638|nr:uncharacterized protein TRAVEDRAFT_71854 [Trametes versicolor FP-101664 SS1]EIW58150.1 hypothetical protein TRAVEDRAFT_71854 [Trametes versicolor FP-101664 SS1]